MSSANPHISPKARRLINRLVARSEDMAFLGSMHPDTQAEVEGAFKLAKAKLVEFISDLEGHNK